MKLTERSVRKPAQIRRREILEAARKVFCEHSFDSVSMEEVAKKVGISKAAIYLYYKSKHDLFTAMIESSMDEEIAELRTVMEIESPNGISSQLKAVFEAFRRHAPVMASVRRLFETGCPPSLPQPCVRSFMRNLRSRAEEILRLLSSAFAKAQEEGEVRRDLSQQELARIFLGFVSAVAKIEMNLDTAREVFLKGILAKEVKQ